MTGSEFLSAELAKLAYLDGFEAGLNGMLACSYVIRNRVRAGWGSWDQVLSRHQLWSWRKDIPNIYFCPSPNTYSFLQLLQQISRIYSGEQEDTVTIASDPVKNYISVGPPAPVALWYGKLNEISNSFFQGNICNNPEHKLIATVHPLSFFS